MSTLLMYIGIFVLSFVIWEMVRVLYYTRKGITAGKNAILVSKTRPNPRKRMLVIGDCGTVSVGVSSPEYSIVGRLARDFEDIEIVNASKNSMSFGHLADTLRNLQHEHFDIVIIHIGAMDTFTFTRKNVLSAHFRLVHEYTNAMGAGTVALVSMCNIGSFPLLRFPVNKLFDWRSYKLSQHFNTLCDSYGILHIPLYESATSDQLTHPESLFTEDMVHPNDMGHGVWYAKIKSKISSYINT